MKLVATILVMLMSFGAAPATSESVRFATVDVIIDAKGKPLAAYQVEFVADSSVKLVGIEGGDHAAFKAPPYYDPAALSNNRVILAAFSAGTDLPKSSFRAARLHLQISTSEKPKMEIKPIVTADAVGAKVPADVTLREGVSP